MNRRERRAAAKRGRSGARVLPPGAGQLGSINIYDGTVNTGGGDIVGGNKSGLDERKLIALLEERGHLAGLPLMVVRKIVEAFGEQAQDFNADRIEQLLIKKADDYRALKERLDRLSDDDPIVQALRGKASSLLDAGDFAGADARLADAEKRDLASAIEQEEIAKRKRLSAAETRGARGDAAMLHLAYRDAAEHYEEAARISAPWRGSEQHRRWLVRRADAFLAQGHDFGDNVALEEAIAEYNSCLELTPRDSAPLDWATCQCELGRALTILGERESGTARLEAAVIAARVLELVRGYPRVIDRWTADDARDAAQTFDGLKQLARDAIAFSYADLERLLIALDGDRRKLAVRISLVPLAEDAEAWRALRPVVLAGLETDALDDLRLSNVLEKEAEAPKFGHTMRRYAAAAFLRAHRREAVRAEAEGLILALARSIMAIDLGSIHYASALRALRGVASRLNLAKHI